MVPQSAVVVWQLRGFVEDVHCFLIRRGAGFDIAIERAGERLLQEHFTRLSDLMLRAGELKANLEQVGFAPMPRLDADEAGQPLEPLLRAFVEAGRAPLYRVAS
jgi:hypothetical protein